MDVETASVITGSSEIFMQVVSRVLLKRLSKMFRIVDILIAVLRL